MSACASNPCLSSGVCLERLVSYYCICPPGFNGTNCQNSINYCSSNPCQNSGICSQVNPTTIQCQCPIGTTGSFCEIVIDVSFKLFFEFFASFIYIKIKIGLFKYSLLE